MICLSVSTQSGIRIRLLVSWCDLYFMWSNNDDDFCKYDCKSWKRKEKNRIIF